MKMGERIRELRHQKQLTQEDLAQLLGLQKSAIAKYENGRVINIKQSTLFKMSQLFNVTPDDILCAAEQDKKQNQIIKESDKELLYYYNQLNERGQEKAMEHLYDLTQIKAYQKHIANHLMPVAAHNDSAYDEEQQRLMQEDLEEI